MNNYQTNGIDVSYCQTKVDWNKVKASGISFAMIRVGFCYNNGTIKVDKMYHSHMKGALNAGLDVGIYLYSYATSPTAARIAAQETIKLVSPYKVTYPIAFDMEYEDIYTKSTKESNSAICAAYCDEIEKLGYYAMIYASKDFLNHLLDMNQLKRFDVWCAQYASSCTYIGGYGIWQYIGDKGRVDGVEGACDRNIGYKDYPAIMKRAKLNKIV